MNAAEARARADELDAKARRHKRAIREHRKGLNRTREQLRRLSAVCAEHGIALHISGDERHG